MKVGGGDMERMILWRLTQLRHRPIQEMLLQWIVLVRSHPCILTREDVIKSHQICGHTQSVHFVLDIGLLFLILSGYQFSAERARRSEGNRPRQGEEGPGWGGGGGGVGG